MKKLIKIITSTVLIFILGMCIFMMAYAFVMGITANAEFSGKNLISNNVADWEQGNIPTSSAIGSTYSEIKGQSTTRIRIKELIRVNNPITFSFNDTLFDVFITLFDINQLYLGQYSGWNQTTFTETRNCEYIAIEVSKKDNSTITASDIETVFLQGELGFTATDYEPYYKPTYDGSFKILTSNGYNMLMPYTFYTDLDYINQYDNESVLITLDSNLSNGALEPFSYFAVAYPLESGNYLWLVFESIQRSFSHYGDDDFYGNEQYLAFNIYSYIFGAEDFAILDFNLGDNVFNPIVDLNATLILNSLDGNYPPTYSIPYNSSEPIQLMVNPSTNDLTNPSFNFNVMHNKGHFLYNFEIPQDFLNGEKMKSDSDVYYLLSILTDYTELPFERTIKHSVIDSLDYVDVKYNNVLTNYFDNNFQDGYKAGYQEGYEKGYQDGYDKNAYQEGFKQSLIDAFPAGLGAVASIIMAFFNIEIFGFKPLYILIGISGLSLALIIYRVLRGN